MFYHIMAAALAFLDLTLKSGIEQVRDGRFPRVIPGTKGKVQLRKLHNDGFPLGFLRERPETVRCLPLAMASILLLKLSLLLPQKGRILRKAGTAVALGGGASNLFDRFFRGYVVDYLYVDVKPLNKIIFNLGDVFIALGMVIAGLGEAADSATGKGRKH